MFRFTPQTIPSQIFVVGCGGTGSRLVPLLTQFIASISKDKSSRGWLDNPTIFLIDDDTVEQKNLARQNFVPPDVGKNKAAVLAQRYGKAYGVNVIPIMKRVQGSARDLFSDVAGAPSFNQSMVIMCVDTAEARRSILSAVNDHCSPRVAGQGPFFIDAGNEDNFGQVRFFNQAVATDLHRMAESLTLPKMSPVTIDIPVIPMDVKFYEELVDMPGQGSCADLDQTLAINALMATLIMGIVQNYYYVKPMTFNQISISLDGSVSTSFNTPSDFRRRALSESECYRNRSFRHNHARYFEIADYLTKFIRETDAAIEAMQATVVAETAIETKAEEAPAPKKRSRKKAVEVEETPVGTPEQVMYEAHRDGAFALLEAAAVDVEAEARAS